MSHWVIEQGRSLTRRCLLLSIVSAAFARSSWSAVAPDSLAIQLADIQANLGGRLGVHAFDTATGHSTGLNAHDRFAMCSTFKLLLAAAVLKRVDAGQLKLQQPVKFGAADMLPHAPVTSVKLAQGEMTIEQLCAAAVEVSDNPAANLLLSLIGGPGELTEELRNSGDSVTRLDRTEVALNTNLRGDPRDTTTPHAMAHSIARVLIGELLSPASRRLLIGWMTASSSGQRRIRAGLPANWKAGDKTGTGANGAVNDVGVLWPPGRAPIILTIYMTESSRPVTELEAGHAQVARLIATTFAAV